MRTVQSSFFLSRGSRFNNSSVIPPRDHIAACAKVSFISASPRVSPRLSLSHRRWRSQPSDSETQRCLLPPRRSHPENRISSIRTSRLLFCAGWYWIPRPLACTTITEASIDRWAPGRATRGTSKPRLMEAAAGWHSPAMFINGNRYCPAHRCPRARTSGPGWPRARTTTRTMKTKRASKAWAGIPAYRTAPAAASSRSTCRRRFARSRVFPRKNGKRFSVRERAKAGFVALEKYFLSKNAKTRGELYLYLGKVTSMKIRFYKISIIIFLRV